MPTEAEYRPGHAGYTRIDPLRTMLEVEDLNRLHDLSGSTLYSAELKRLPLLSRAEQQPLVTQARRGDQAAKDALVIHCLHWTIRRAARIYRQHRPKHLDLMDLVGVANVEIMEKFERALEKPDPVTFLLSSAAYEMQSHVGTNDSVIIKPRYGREKMKRLDPVPATTVSLDAPSPNGEHPLVETLTADHHPTQDAVKQRSKRTYTILHQAVNELSPTLRRAIVELYGLFGQPARTKQEMAQAAQITPRGIRDADLRARKQLAERLAPYGTIFTRS